MKNILLMIIGFLMTIAIINFLVFKAIKKNDLRYIKEVTGISMPTEYRVVDEFDNGEIYITGAFEILNSIEPFIKKNCFLPFNEHDMIDPLIGKELKRKPLPKVGSGYFILTGRSENNTWQFIVNKKEKACWYVIQYPDYNGDKP